MTLCGSPSYVAPEILNKQMYGVKCDLWSAGVLAFAMIGGYQPFRGKTEDDVKQKIAKGRYTFDARYWSHVSDSGHDFIDSLLVVDPQDRASAEDILKHSWFTQDLLTDTKPMERSNEKPVSCIFSV